MSAQHQRIAALEAWRAARAAPDATSIAFDYIGEDGRWRSVALVNGATLTEEEFAARYPIATWPDQVLMGVDPHRV